MSSPSKTKSGSSSPTNGRPTDPGGRRRKKLDDFLAELRVLTPGEWKTWAEKLVARRRPLSLRKLFPGSRRHPLAWSADQVMELEAAPEIMSLLQLKRQPRSTEQAEWPPLIQRWLRDASTSAPCPAWAGTCLAWAHALPRLAVRLPSDIWQELFARLWQTADEASDASLQDLCAPQQAVVHQLLAGELPLTLAYWFPNTKSCQTLSKPARTALSEGLIELLDGEGMPHAHYVPHWRSLLACWTRSVALGQNVPKGQPSAKARLQFEWLVRQTIRWRRPDGSMMFEDPTTSQTAVDDLLTGALRLGGDRADHDLWDCSRGRKKPQRSRYVLPRPGEHSEWGELWVMRTAWARDAAYLAGTCADGRLETELGSGSHLLWSGSDMPEVRVAGELLTSDSEWQELCWSSDKDMDYVELQLDLSDGWHVQRHMLLARADRFLLTADAVLGPEAAPIDYRRTLPLLKDVRFEAESETVEAHLRQRRRVCCVMPLALAEWRGQTHLGRFEKGRLHQQASAQTLFAPLWIDLDPERRRRPRTWRQLTVGFQRNLVPRDQAVAYRVQIGSQQWIIYRSLTAPKARTFLGQHLTSEFLVARFDVDGELENLVEVEPA